LQRKVPKGFRKEPPRRRLPLQT